MDKLDLVNQDGIVMLARYDELLSRFLNEEAVFVVDNGATAFLPFWTYLVESNVPTVLREAGRRVYVHIPVSGGEMLNDTLPGFQDPCGKRRGEEPRRLDRRILRLRLT